MTTRPPASWTCCDVHRNPPDDKGSKFGRPRRTAIVAAADAGTRVGPGTLCHLGSPPHPEPVSPLRVASFQARSTPHRHVMPPMAPAARSPEAKEGALLPESWVQVTVILGVVVPGFVYQTSRRSVGGPHPDERELGVRVLRAMATSAVFAAIYAIIIGSAIDSYVHEPTKVLADVRWVGLALLILVVGVPWLSARTVFYVRTAPWFQNATGWLADRLRLRRPWNPTPSAWDFAFAQAEPGWVRVRLADGSWVGGWFAANSFASSFPEPQELYIEVGYVMSEDGTFTKDISAPGGMIVRCQESVIVDFIPA